MDVQWLIGILIATATFILGAIGGVIARDRALTSMITGGDDKLHERINRLREDLSDNYVRRVDLDAHMARIDRNISELRDDVKENTRAMNALLSHVKQPSP